jgi:electron transport complex protein RnfG
MIATLALAGFCSGIAVVGVYLLTKPRIDRNRAEALEAAIFRVLQGASTRMPFALRGDRVVRLEGAAEVLPDDEVVYGGYDEAGSLVGFAIPAEGGGFQDTIKLLYGYDPARRRVVGMQVLESRETPGLGDKILKDAAFLESFRDLSVEPEVALAKGAREGPNEVDSISGATISSRAVVRIINRANERWLEPLSGADSAVRPARTADAQGRAE